MTQISQKLDIIPKILIIGSGRVARHFCYYYQNFHSVDLLFWNRREHDEMGLKTRLQQATHVLVAIKDSALIDFCKNLSILPQTQIIHFSGALEVPNATSVHPLMSFGGSYFTQNEYEKIHFVVGSNLHLNKFLPFFPNTHSAIHSEDKAKYHALCVLGGNFTTILVKKMIEEFENLKIPRMAAQVYVEKILDNVFTQPEAALTGPLPRRDFATIDKNRAALAQDRFVYIYDAFVRAECPDYFTQTKTKGSKE